jgi:hypothetical protein
LAPKNRSINTAARTTTMNELSLALSCRSTYAGFRDAAARELAHRHRRRDLQRRKLNMLVAALILASGVFGATMLIAPPTSRAKLGAPQSAACLKAERTLAPWFASELNRRGLTGTPRQDDFNLMLVGFKDAQSQCASGLTDQALGNFEALANRVVQAEERRHEADD